MTSTAHTQQTLIRAGRLIDTNQKTVKNNIDILIITGGENIIDPERMEKEDNTFRLRDKNELNLIKRAIQKAPPALCLHFSWLIPLRRLVALPTVLSG